jgi:hypothetical protein
VLPSTAGRCQLNDGSVASKGTSRLPVVRHVPVTAGRAGQLPTSSRPRVLSSSSLSASTLDFDTDDGRPGDGSKVRVAVRRARASAIAHHNPMVTTTAVTTPHDDTANRDKIMNRSNGCSLELDGRLVRPVSTRLPRTLSKGYPTSPATQGSFSGSRSVTSTGTQRRLSSSNLRPIHRPPPDRFSEHSPTAISTAARLPTCHRSRCRVAAHQRAPPPQRPWQPPVGPANRPHRQRAPLTTHVATTSEQPAPNSSG